ncbi:uncharacterized protein LOC112093469 [Morus notabilis]|uniref:uncharacterized protein LOC112093469 n=1 Tax=Morus notabilis TaxID=981085 RepID=UPI000CED44A5|nr:uncharacterized protein LOC112093469 [Morus notabilis]
MAKNLKLNTVPHPQPYKILWFQNGSGFKVTKCCLVSFSIGKTYKDEIWCDVVPMDACHSLLGRPWQFDRWVMHDGFNNTHSFVKNGLRITLAPVKPNGIDVKKESNLFLIGSQTLESISKGNTPAILLVVKTNDLVYSEIPELIRPLLEEFSNIVPEEIPDGMPPMKNIQHRMNLVLGASLPNNATYRLNPIQ